MEQRTAEEISRQILYDQTHIIEWAERTLWIADPRTGGIGPLRLNAKQKRFLTEATRLDLFGNLVHKTVVASTPKREGKSLLVAILIAHRLCCCIMERSIVLANSERQAASNIFDELLGFFRNSPGLGDYATEDDLQVRSISVRASGSDVRCVPCNYRTVQGMKVTGILATDELADAPDFAPFSFLSSQTESAHAQIAVSSQAGAPVEANPVWRLYRAAQAQDPGDGEWLGTTGSIFFWYMQHHFAPWARALAESDRVKDLPSEWAYKHENAWAGMGEKLFGAELVAAACMDYDEPQTRQEWDALLAAWGHANLPWCVGVGLDRAGVSRSGDRTVWTVTARLDGLGPGNELYRLVACWVLETGSEAEVLECDRRTEAIFGRVAAKEFEYYGCGDVVEKCDNAELVTPTPKWQMGMFGTWHRLLREGRYGFSQDAGVEPVKRTPGLLKQEFIAFENSGSGTSMRFGTQTGVHDDCVYSGGHGLMGIVGAPEEQQSSGVTTATAGKPRVYGMRVR